MKLLGAELLLCTGILAGSAAARNLERRAATLRLLRQMLTAMMQELNAMLPLTADLLRDLAGMPAFAALPFLQEAAAEPEAFPASWSEAVCRDKTLPDGAAEVLLSVGQTLGSTTLNAQLAAMQLSLERLTALQSDAEAQSTEKGKLCRSMGLLTALFAAILLL